MIGNQHDFARELIRRRWWCLPRRERKWYAQLALVEYWDWLALQEVQEKLERPERLNPVQQQRLQEEREHLMLRQRVRLQEEWEPLKLEWNKVQEPKLVKLKTWLTSKPGSKGENWAKSFGWFIPRKYRHIIGDILEDCSEMRDLKYTERRIKFQVVSQWLIAVVTLVPMAVKTSITDILKQVLSPPK